MLVSLYVKNLALIEEEEIFFNKGLTILTGETGAGKSILIGSLAIIRGNKVDKSLIRNGCDFAFIETVFEVDKSTGEKLEALGVFPEDSRVIISRRITKQRTITKINNETVTNSLLNSVSAILLDICGQRENQSLVKKSRHLELVDAFGGSKVQGVKDSVREAYKAYKAVLKELENSGMDEQERQRRLDFARFEIDEIEKVAPMEEDEELEERFRVMNNAVNLKESLCNVNEIINEMDFSSIYRNLNSVVSMDSKGINAFLEKVNETEAELNELNINIAGYIDELEFSDEDFFETENRLNDINRLKQKYGNSVELINEYLENKKAEVEKLVDNEERIRKLDLLLKEKENEYLKNCEELTKARLESAKELCEKTVEAMKELSFLKVSFNIKHSTLNSYSENGRDDIGFVISLNPGEPLKPLDEIASGGELSRVLLAIKSVMADRDDIDTVVFDEIDTGISGNTANSVARLLKDLSKKRQVICITHLPAIASASDDHFKIYKEAVEDRTVTKIKSLDNEESIRELAQMTGNTSKSAIDNAREMKEVYS